MKLGSFVLFIAGLCLVACSNSEKIVSDELGVPAEIPQDSIENNSLSQDSLLRDSLLKDSLFKDSLYKDSLIRLDSIHRADSLAQMELLRKSGLSLIASNGLSIELGTNSAEARVNERPAMKVSFTYDFYVSRHETTCAEFNGLMKSVTGLALDCENDSLPVTNVTYYDAVLFANERSKREGLDTAYTYVSKKMDSEGHCVNLEGYAYHPEIESFHLPTEAEWMVVAQKNWFSEKSWTAENSDFKLHPVCSKAEDSEICDMMGNAMEWVNDWFGLFRDTTLQNYAGAPDGGKVAQRIVKGGSFRSKVSSTTLYARGDIYSVTSSTRGDYLGFRLVRGSVPDASWMGSDGRAISSRITPLANASSVYSYSKTYKAKLAFRNDVSGNIAFVDYSNGALSVVEILDTIDAYHPEISPDGNHVAFCTKYEGVEGKSELYVRDLDENGSNLVKLDAESAAIPRWRVLENGDTVIVYVTDAGNNKSETVFRATSTWQVPFSNGRFGVPQKLFDGAYHGGISSDDHLAVSGARLLRARVSDHDTVWYNGEQACNVSLSQDGSNRTMFLDFGSSTGRDFVGKRYATHQRLFIADSTGRLVHSVQAPAGFSFDHAEWVGRLDLAVASLVNSNGSHRKVVLVDLVNDEVVELAEGEELWHPSLWIYESGFETKNFELDLDSAGIYFDNPSDPLLSYKMNIFWIEADSIEVVALGSSRMSAGFNSNLITYGKSFNMATIPSDMDIFMYLAEFYIHKHCPRLKALVVGIDFDLWYDLESATVMKNILSYPGYFYDYNHQFWVDGGVDQIKMISAKIVDESTVYQDMHRNMGWVYVAESPFEENPEFSGFMFGRDSTWSDDSTTYRRAMNNLDFIIRSAAIKGVNVVGVIFPQSPEYKNSGAFGRHGMRRSHAMKLLEEVQELAQKYGNFYLLDENKMGDHDYAMSMAYDYDHLNYRGAEKITARIDSVLNSIK